MQLMHRSFGLISLPDSFKLQNNIAGIKFEGFEKPGIFEQGGKATLLI